MRLLLASLLSAGAALLTQVSAPATSETAASSGPSVTSTRTASTQAAPARFLAVNVFVDPAGVPLAAYQFELKATGAVVRIVGVEGGEHAAFREPPYYDAAALRHEHIIIAAFNTGRDLPAARTRVARLHLEVTGGQPVFETRLTVAASPRGDSIPAHISVEEGDHS